MGNMMISKGRESTKLERATEVIFTSLREMNKEEFIPIRLKEKESRIMKKKYRNSDDSEGGLITSQQFILLQHPLIEKE